jgi:hypothetical protein
VAENPEKNDLREDKSDYEVPFAATTRVQVMDEEVK